MKFCNDVSSEFVILFIESFIIKCYVMNKIHTQSSSTYYSKFKKKKKKKTYAIFLISVLMGKGLFVRTFLKN